MVARSVVEASQLWLSGVSLRIVSCGCCHSYRVMANRRPALKCHYNMIQVQPNGEHN